MKRPASLARVLLCGVSFLSFVVATGFPALSAGQQQAPAKPETSTSGSQPSGGTPRFAGFENNFVMRVTDGTLFENVVSALQAKYYDKNFRENSLPQLIAKYAPKARQATTLEQEREVVEELLSNIPSSHLGLLSKRSHHDVMFDLMGRPYPTLGFQLVELKGKFYAFAVLEGGPAMKSGLLPWDRIVSIDGVATEKSPRVDWRSDDAYIGDDRDPPVHYLIVQPGEDISLKIERSQGEFQALHVSASDYSAIDAARASARVLTSGHHQIGYLHLWYIHLNGAPDLLQKELDGEFSKCDAFIFDLRGRGGSAAMIPRIVEVLKRDQANRHRPIVALIDRQSRSAKDVIAYELKTSGIARLVGEPTAGAVIPASFADVGHDSILMFPTFKLPRYTEILESKPVQPDVLVERAGPFSAGKDPILDAGISEAARLADSAVKQSTM